MKTHERSAKPVRPGRRHPLTLQQQLNEQTFWISLVIVALSTGLLIWNPPEAARYRSTLWVALVGTGLILLLTFVYRFRAYVQCREHELSIQLPFHRLSVPYSNIRATRPNEFFRLFPPEDQTWSQRSFLHGLWDSTVVVVDLTELPGTRRQLRLWMSKYMLDPNGPSLSLPVHDWIALRSELDEQLSQHRRSTRRQ